MSDLVTSLEKLAELERLMDTFSRRGKFANWQEIEASALLLCGYEARSKIIQLVEDGLRRELAAARTVVAVQLKDKKVAP